MSRPHRSIPKGFVKWPEDNGLGYSFNINGKRGEMFPERDEGHGLIGWTGYFIASDGKKTTTGIWCDNHWDCADEINLMAGGV